MYFSGAEYGAVTALGINTTTTRLLCGHAKGQVTFGKKIYQKAEVYSLQVSHTLF